MVTGASAGIGAYVAEILVRSGLKVVGLARRREILEEMAQRFAAHQPGSFYPVKCDLRKEEDIQEAFKYVEEKVGPVHVLINNAGFMASERIIGRFDNVLILLSMRGSKLLALYLAMFLHISFVRKM